jgi:hypothetical protein
MTGKCGGGGGVCARFIKKARKCEQSNPNMEHRKANKQTTHKNKKQARASWIS